MKRLFSRLFLIGFTLFLGEFVPELSAQFYGGRARASNLSVTPFRTTFINSLKLRPIIQLATVTPAAQNNRNHQQPNEVKQRFSLTPNFRKYLRFSLRNPNLTYHFTAKNPVDRALQITLDQTKHQKTRSTSRSYASLKNQRLSTLWPDPEKMVWLFDTQTANAYHINPDCGVFKNTNNTLTAITSVPLSLLLVRSSLLSIQNTSRRPCKICSRGYPDPVVPFHGLN